ncbi:hypothetical protein [Fischerella sp. JS2]|uniref:hypothetical protein n=1 Tax=Fischerella sp. JS2 TaxID=2597771 RepID=UPI0028EE3A9A|nr:hypothetical protein [Fischerella sp. JS2]
MARKDFDSIVNVIIQARSIWNNVANNTYHLFTNSIYLRYLRENNIFDVARRIEKTKRVRFSKNAERINFAIKGEKLIYKLRQNNKNNSNSQESQTQYLCSTEKADLTKTRRWIGCAVKLVNENKTH